MIADFGVHKVVLPPLGDEALARAVELEREFGSLSEFFWQFVPPRSERPEELTRESLRTLSRTPTSQRLSTELKKRGWTYKKASNELVEFIYVRPGVTNIQRAEKNEDYFESETAVLKWVETFYAGWRECIALTDELGEQICSCISGGKSWRRSLSSILCDCQRNW